MAPAVAARELERRALADLEGTRSEDQRGLLSERVEDRRLSGRWRLAAAFTCAALGAAAVARLAVGPRGARVRSVQEEVAEEPSRAATPEESQRRFRAREPLGIEGDLGARVTDLPRDMAPGGGRTIEESSAALFDHFLASSGLHGELTSWESEAFKARFTKEMVWQLSSDEDAGSAYVNVAKEALESQKPVMTEALAKSLNKAGLGFRVEMRAWLVQESKTTLQRRLGRTRDPAKAKAHEASSRQRDVVRAGLPAKFDAREKWPECAEVVGRIHDQGLCGSCWVFAALGPLDSRLCIHTRCDADGFAGDVAKLSRGYATSCFADGRDGCGGGWEYTVYEAVEGGQGAPTEDCSPYFGVDPDFNVTIGAPACPSACEAAYPRSMDEDYFKPTGVGNYQMVFSPSSADLEFVKSKIFEGGPVSFGIYATQNFMAYSDGIFDLDCGEDWANHALQAIGWGDGYLLAQNSWGEEWGLSGRARVAPCVATDFTIPGDIVASDFPLPLPNSTAPTPAPPPYAPECTVDSEGCISSPNYPSKYPAQSSCVIYRSFGKISVKAFETETTYDYLFVNGERYSGVEGPQGVVPETDIVWSSDLAVEAKGWKICPAGGATGRRVHVHALLLASFSCVWRLLR